MLSYRGAESRKCDFVTDYLSNRNYYLMSGVLGDTQILLVTSFIFTN